MNRHFVSDKEGNASAENSKVIFSKSDPLNLQNLWQEDSVTV